MKSMKNILRKSALIFMTALTLSTPTLNAIADSTSDISKPYNQVCATTADGNITSDDSSGASGATGDWTQKGTDANKNAQAIFDQLTKKNGFSGAGAAGALANAKRESGFDPKAVNSGGGVAGLFQWSGWGNSINGNRIISEGSIKRGDTSTLTTENELKLVNHEINGSYSKVKSSVGRSTSPTEAAKNWSQDYEGVSLDDSQTNLNQIVADAKTAYEAFGGASISADDSLIGDNTGTQSNTDASSSTSSQATCNSSTGSVSEPDGTGTHTQAVGSHWKDYADLPADVKKYAHDISKLIGTRGSGDKWISLGVSSASYNQCVGFSVAYGNAIWGLSGNKTGNGIDTANSFASQTSTKTSGTPKAGAIASQTSSLTDAGHTFVVMHVYQNGDILLAEQNFSGASGAGNNETFSWDFRIESKAGLASNNTKYDYPGDNSKYKLKW